MFIWSARASRIWPVLGVCLLAVIVAAALLFSGDPPQVQNALPVATEVKAPASSVSSAAAGRSERLSFLKQFGWVVDTENEVQRTVTLPTRADAVYDAFHQLQQAQGLDLSPYDGTQVQAYTYRILNYPDSSLNVFAELLVRQDKVIGGEIYATGEQSFEHGFAYERPQGK